ncbi:MAG: hypothetical protein KDA32_01410 [Phycisphaerales bacterium]|nr:hypothetical protein [Phycisphaerales bacterium]
MTRAASSEHGLIRRVWGARWKAALLTGCVTASVAFWQSQYLPQRYQAAATLKPRDPLVGVTVEGAEALATAIAELRVDAASALSGADARRQAAIAVGLLPPEEPDDDQATSDALLAAALRVYHIETNVDQAKSEIRVTCEADEPDVARQYLRALIDDAVARGATRLREVVTNAHATALATVAQPEIATETEPAPAPLPKPVAPDAPTTDPLTLATRLAAAETESGRLTRELGQLRAAAEIRREFLNRIPEQSAPLATAVANGVPSATLNTPITANAPMAVESTPIAGVIQLVAANEPTQAPTATPEEVRPSSPSILGAYDQLVADAEAELLDARTTRRMTDAHPDVIALQQKIGQARDLRSQALARIGETRPGAPTQSDSSPISDGALAAIRAAIRESEREQMRLEIALLDRDIEVVQASLDETSAQAVTLAAAYESARRPVAPGAAPSTPAPTRPIREPVSAAPQYATALGRLLDSDDPDVLALFTVPGEVSARSMGPSPAFVVGACAGIGLVAAFLVCPLMALARRRFSSAEAVASALGVPVLARIPVINTPGERKRRLHSFLMWTPTLAAACVATGLLGTMAYARLAAPSLYDAIRTRGQVVWNMFGGPRSANASEATTDKAGK